MACNIDLRNEGRPYPRTCNDCGLGPCKKYPPKMIDGCLVGAAGANNSVPPVFGHITRSNGPPYRMFDDIRNNGGIIQVGTTKGVLILGRIGHCLELSKQHVEELIPILQRWLETGGL